MLFFVCLKKPISKKLLYLILKGERTFQRAEVGRSAVVMAAGRVFVLSVLLLYLLSFSSLLGQKCNWNRSFSDPNLSFHKLCPSYSESCALLHLTETWRNALDKGLKVGVLFIDFRKAFDTANHTILQEKLKAIGVSGDLLSRLDDYMSARKQFVELSEYQSEPKTITFGVPQGSILGPKLFSIFVNDLPESITSGNVFMFADDTTIYTISKDIDNITLTLQSILDQVYTWCQSNRLIAHESKTEAMIISRQSFIGPLRRLTYGSSTIEYKQSSKCLGLTVDNKLSWYEHIGNVCKSFSNKVAVLKRIKFLPKPVLETIYYKTIIPSVLYGIAVWGSCSPAC